MKKSYYILLHCFIIVIIVPNTFRIDGIQNIIFDFTKTNMIFFNDHFLKLYLSKSVLVRHWKGISNNGFSGKVK